MKKTASVQYPIHELLAERWSPVSFRSEPVSREQIGSLLEAARWAPSSYNEQPWKFIVATQNDSEQFGKMLSCLVPGNQAWAKSVPLLMLSVASLRFERNNKENRHALHDVGLATANLVIQATALGLAAHQMAGFDVSKARDQFQIPDGWEPVAVAAIGHPAALDDLPDDYRDRDLAPRQRKPLAEIATLGNWSDDAGTGLDS